MHAPAAGTGQELEHETAQSKKHMDSTKSATNFIAHEDLHLAVAEETSPKEET